MLLRESKKEPEFPAKLAIRKLRGMAQPSSIMIVKINISLLNTLIIPISENFRSIIRFYWFYTEFANKSDRNFFGITQQPGQIPRSTGAIRWAKHGV
jgi:hypothetical protein